VAPFIGGIFGGPIGGILSDSLGRKMSLVLNSIPLGGGYFMLLYTYLISDGVMFKVLLFMGRFLTGIGIGWSCLTAPVREHAHFTCLCLGQNRGKGEGEYVKCAETWESYIVNVVL
jgi:MFS family permease